MNVIRCTRPGCDGHAVKELGRDNTVLAADLVADGHPTHVNKDHRYLCTEGHEFIADPTARASE